MKPTLKMIKKTIKKTIKKQTEYDKVIDALNLIDETAEAYSDESYDEKVERGRAYDLVATFIDKHAKR